MLAMLEGSKTGLWSLSERLISSCIFVGPLSSPCFCGLRARSVGSRLGDVFVFNFFAERIGGPMSRSLYMEWLRETLLEEGMDPLEPLVFMVLKGTLNLKRYRSDT